MVRHECCSRSIWSQWYRVENPRVDRFVKNNWLVSINRTMAVALPCGRPVRCSSIQLSATASSNTTVIRKSQYNSGSDRTFVRATSMDNITHRLVSIYQTNAYRKMLLELQSDIIDLPSSNTFPYRAHHRFSYIKLTWIKTHLLVRLRRRQTSVDRTNARRLTQYHQPFYSLDSWLRQKWHAHLRFNRFFPSAYA